MRIPFYFLLISILFGCSKENTTNENYIASLESTLGVSAASAPNGNKGVFFENVVYDSGSRNQLDILLPENQSPKGVLVYFHGGSFIFGDKSSIFDEAFETTINSILAADIAVVSANYTFLDSPESEGVLTALEDGSTVISFIEDLREVLQLPSNKIILSGGSAGAGIAQWNGFRETTNTQVQGVVALEAQSSYDLYEWETVFPGLDLDAIRQENPELNSLFLAFYNGDPSEEKLDLLDYRAAIDSNDPPLYVLNQLSGQELFDENGNLDVDVLFHSFRHADYLRLKAIQEGLEFSGAYQESPEGFILRMLGL